MLMVALAGAVLMVAGVTAVGTRYDTFVLRMAGAGWALVLIGLLGYAITMVEG